MRKCIQCGQIFTIKPHEGKVRFSTRKFCSQKCYKISDSYRKSLFKKGHDGLNFDKNPAWKGGKSIDDKGYVRLAIGKKNWRYEHRLVMENHIGRALRKEEHVHHINGDKTNNSISNLLLLPNARAHSKFHKPKWLL